MRWVERRLAFDFSAAVRAERLDEQGRPAPVGMSFVDFVVHEEDRVLLVEVKDPQGAPEQRREKEIERFVQELRRKTLVNEIFVPKARDSYTYLHLMERDDKPFVYVVVLGIGPGDPALLLDLKKRILGRLRHEAEEPWKRVYISDCVVLTPDSWNTFVERYPVTVNVE